MDDIFQIGKFNKEKKDKFFERRKISYVTHEGCKQGGQDPRCLVVQGF
jgi:hypothetical protein